jgi:hypothetical protein
MLLWDKREEQFLTESVGKKPLKLIAMELGRPQSGVLAKAKKMGLMPSGLQKTKTETQQLETQQDKIEPVPESTTSLSGGLLIRIGNVTTHRMV